eukprot:TRINITY_DN2158_c0_g1_i1.p1 TRINITY_DN2158_c0_g1~~TRINITY_DN2158_c0_g1_i1.p1  ORF type:complete len:111 (+),score=20.76 TRINITY_DN2158_c0_g1_i1:81-413(+)
MPTLLSLFTVSLFFVVGGNVILVLFFILGWLPLAIARPVGRMIHLPGLIMTVVLFKLGLRGDWWNEIDETVVLGAIPFPSHVEQLASMGVKATINLWSIRVNSSQQPSDL